MSFIFKVEPFLIYGIIKGLLYALLGIGFCLVYRTTRIFHVSFGLIFITTSYLAFYFLRLLHWPEALSIIVSLIGGCLLGYGIESCVYRPLSRKGAHSGVFLISSIGVNIVGINIITLLFGNETRLLRAGPSNTIMFDRTILTVTQLFQLVISVIIITFFFVLMKKFKLGRLITALANNPELFRILGWSEEAFRNSVFVLSSLLAGLASLLMSFDVGMDPNMGMNALLTGAVAMILGGGKNLAGAGLAGVSIGIIQSLVALKTSGRWEQAVTFFLLIIYLLVFRKRIVGRLRIEEE